MPNQADTSLEVQPVPNWGELPDYVQRDLASREYDADWFTRHKDDPTMRLTVLTLYVKLSGLGLWSYVQAESGSALGCLHFLSAESLPDVLRARADFTDPAQRAKAWDSRERRAEGALHFKHFVDWPEFKVQAHIDPEGLLLCSDAWWLVPIVPLTQIIAHNLDPEGYKDVYRIRKILLKQGWDPTPIIGQR